VRFGSIQDSVDNATSHFLAVLPSRLAGCRSEFSQKVAREIAGVLTDYRVIGTSTVPVKTGEKWLIVKNILWRLRRQQS
jgi:hypothetical protein